MTYRVVIVACAIVVAASCAGGKTSNFPNIADWNTLKITLERSPCFGACPNYRLEIRGDGTVIYDGVNFVDVKGHREDRVPVAAVQGLFRQFQQADYFSLQDEYRARITDYPTHRTSIAFDDKSKSVTNYAGAMVGMPYVVIELEQAIDRTAGAEKWIGDPRYPPDPP